RSLGRLRSGAAARLEGAARRLDGTRRVGATDRAGPAPAGARIAAADFARWRTPHPQPVGAARGVARSDRQPPRPARPSDGDTNAVEIQADGSLGHAPDTVHCERAEEHGHQWIAATHDGYQPRFGLSYSRELYLAPDGDDLRGEDRLTGRAGEPFAVRFHLHPAVEASLAADNSAAVLRLPGGAVWQLRVA